MREIPAFQYKIYRNAVGKEISVKNFQTQQFDLIIDALIGYSLRAVPRNIIAELIEWSNAKKCPGISLDVPSGVDSTTGKTPGQFIKPAATLTLALPKTGLLTAETGKLYLADIGIPKSVFHKIGLDYRSPFGKKYWLKLKNEKLKGNFSKVVCENEYKK